MSKTLLASKVVVNEAAPKTRTVAAVETAVWHVVGVTEKGPHETTFIQSFEEYVRLFGGWTTDAKDVPSAVRGYFENGGQFCYVTRIVHYTDITSAASKTSAAGTVTLDDRDDPAVDTLKVSAISDGAWGNALRIDITAATNGDATKFNLVVKHSSGLVLETWPNLSMADGNERYVEDIVNATSGGSVYIVVQDLDSASTPPDDMPALITGAALTGGSDGLTDLADTDFLGSEAGGTGLHRANLKRDITLMSIPGRTSSAVANGLITYIINRDDLFCLAILDPPANTSASGMLTYVNTTASLYNLTELAALYWPRIKVLNPNKTVYGNADTITVPPCGHIAGVYARTDSLRPGGIYLPPAGVERSVLAGCQGVEMTEVTSEKKRDLVYPNLINPVTSLPGWAIHLDGHRTLKRTGNFPSISERRGVLFIERALKELVQPFLHNNNDATLRADVARSIEQFLIGQMQLGAFRTNNPETAFFVDVGEGLNDLAAQRAGILKIRIGLATQSPIDWIVFEFSRDDSLAEDAQVQANA